MERSFFWDKSINDFLLRVNYRRFVRIVELATTARSRLKPGRNFIYRCGNSAHADGAIINFTFTTWYRVTPIMEQNMCTKYLACVTHLHCVDPVRFSHVECSYEKMMWPKLTADISSTIRPHVNRDLLSVILSENATYLISTCRHAVKQFISAYHRYIKIKKYL